MSPSCCQPACCSNPGNKEPGVPLTKSVEPKKLVDAVDAAYSTKAREGVDPTCNILSCALCGLTNFSFLDANKVAAAFGYTSEQLNAVPDGAHMGLSCGNPVATATIKEVYSTAVFTSWHILSPIL